MSENLASEMFDLYFAEIIISVFTVLFILAFIGLMYLVGVTDFLDKDKP